VLLTGFEMDYFLLLDCSRGLRTLPVGECGGSRMIWTGPADCSSVLTYFCPPDPLHCGCVGCCSFVSRSRPEDLLCPLLQSSLRVVMRRNENRIHVSYDFVTTQVPQWPFSSSFLPYMDNKCNEFLPSYEDPQQHKPLLHRKQNTTAFIQKVKEEAGWERIRIGCTNLPEQSLVGGGVRSCLPSGAPT
jgi:hypothetical protein